MPIIVNLDVMMAKRKMSLNELSEKVDLTLSNLSILKTGKAKAIRFSTLEAICEVLNCQPGDILEYAYSDPGGVENVKKYSSTTPINKI
jgi:putative transcriptional regulator